ncbi:MAG: BrnT family toxin [Bacteroidota bacterium]|jgi:uncharacterized DUF497 family protein
MGFFPDFIEFEWDSGNRDKNWRRHRVKWSECEEVFFNMPLLLLPDIEHSLTEERDYAFGKTNNNRLLVVVFTVRDSRIRVISARDMNKKEKRFYYEKTQKPS